MKFSIADILNSAGCPVDGHTYIHVPAWAFIPDHWNVAFIKGLSKLCPNWKGLDVWEVGVGTGANLIALSSQAPADIKWHLSDFDERCVPLALQNLEPFGRKLNLHPLQGSWDLVTPPGGSQMSVPNVDVIFGCLPQVPSQVDLSIADNRSQYYDPVRYPEAGRWNEFGLGLNEALILRAKHVLRPSGKVVLNLSGRPGLKRLRILFEQTGYIPELVHHETIPQHAGTSLTSLADLEGNGHAPFEFFTDQECRRGINAATAEIRRRTGKTVFHKIYVMMGTLT